MSPEQFTYSTQDNQVAEKLVDDPTRWNLLLAHVVLPPGASVPRHEVNADAFFTVVRGTLSLALGDGPREAYPRGRVVHLPKGTLMEPSNQGVEVLEFFVVKTPHPEAAH